MTPLDRIAARLNPKQLSVLAEMLDDVCEEEFGGSFTVFFRARRARHHTRVTIRLAKDVEVGWPQGDGQAELPLNSNGSPLTRST